MLRRFAYLSFPYLFIQMLFFLDSALTFFEVKSVQENTPVKSGLF